MCRALDAVVLLVVRLRVNHARDVSYDKPDLPGTDDVDDCIIANLGFAGGETVTSGLSSASAMVGATMSPPAIAGTDTSEPSASSINDLRETLPI